MKKKAGIILLSRTISIKLFFGSYLKSTQKTLLQLMPVFIKKQIRWFFL